MCSRIPMVYLTWPFTTVRPWVVLPAPSASPTQLAAAWLHMFWTRSDFWINLRSNSKPNPARKAIVLDLGRNIISLQIAVPVTNLSGWRPSVGTADGLAVQKSGLTTAIWLNTSHVQQRERSNFNAQYLNWRCIVARPHFLIISLGRKNSSNTKELYPLRLQLGTVHLYWILQATHDGWHLDQNQVAWIGRRCCGNGSEKGFKINIYLDILNDLVS